MRNLPGRSERDGVQDNAAMYNERPVLTAAVLMGVGLGGLLDGIVLHQILQWHGMVSALRPKVDLEAARTNLLWDGVFQLAMVAVTIAGIARLWTLDRRGAVEHSNRALLGGAAIGWGLFNFGEGLIDHQLLGLHHVHPGEGQLLWDLGFLAFGLALMMGGALALRSEQPMLRSPSYHA